MDNVKLIIEFGLFATLGFFISLLIVELQILIGVCLIVVLVSELLKYRGRKKKDSTHQVISLNKYVLEESKMKESKMDISLSLIAVGILNVLCLFAWDGNWIGNPYLLGLVVGVSTCIVVNKSIKFIKEKYDYSLEMEYDESGNNMGVNEKIIITEKSDYDIKDEYVISDQTMLIEEDNNMTENVHNETVTNLHVNCVEEVNNMTENAHIETVTNLHVNCVEEKTDTTPTVLEMLIALDQDGKFNMELLKLGLLLKRKAWKGYWKYVDGEIIMYCQGDKVINLRVSDDIAFTINNILENDWELASRNNTTVKIE